MQSSTIENKVNSVIAQKIVKNKARLKEQQEYYQRLNKNGILQKQTYTLKPLSSI